MMDIALALDALVPGAEYTGSLTDNTQEAFDALGWTDRRAKPVWAAVLASGADVDKAALEAAVDVERERIISAGAPVNVGGGLSLTLDLRDLSDFRNLQALYSRAETAKREGEGRLLRVRDAGNQEHMISVDQMIALGKAIFDGIDAVYQASWVVKDQVTAGTLTDAADIPAAFNAILTA